MSGRVWIHCDVHLNGGCIRETAKVNVIDKKEYVKVDSLGESREDEFDEYEAVSDSSDKLANGVLESDGEAGGSDIWAPPDKDSSNESLVVTTRGELLLQGGINVTVVWVEIGGHRSWRHI